MTESDIGLLRRLKPIFYILYTGQDFKELRMLCYDARCYIDELKCQIKILVEPIYDEDFKERIFTQRNKIDPYLDLAYDYLHCTSNYFDDIEVTSAKREYEIIERDKNESKN
jgi:hypothetical protein